MKKHLLKSLLALALVLISGSAWASDVVYKTALFGSDYDDSSVNNYTTESWTATNNGFVVSLSYFNNNNKSWNYVKCGNKTSVSKGTITTQSPIDKAITKVVVTVDAVTATSVNSFKLYVAPDNTFTSNLQTYTTSIAVGENTFSISTPTENMYYKIEADCKQGSSNGLVTISRIDYYYDDGKSAVLAPAFNPAAGLYSSTQNVTITTETNGASIYYTTDGTTPTTNSTLYSGAIAVNQNMTLKAIAVKDNMNDSEVVEANYVILSHAGTQNDPYDVNDAHAVIDAGTYNSGVYVKGLVAQVNANLSSGALSYNITIDGSNTNPIRVYNGKSFNGENFSSADDVKVGDEVVVFGNLSKYNSTYQFDADSRLISLKTHVATPSFTPEEGTYGAAQQVRINCTTDGATIYYTLDGSEPTTASILYSGEFTVDATTTVKAFAVKDSFFDSEVATCVFTITTIVGVENVNISPATSSVYIGETLSLSAIVLPENATDKSITWSSSNAAVATVLDGVVTARKVGTAEITATSVADNTKKGTCLITVTAPVGYDVLNNDIVGISGTSYAEWENPIKGVFTGISYKGNSAGGNSSIQLRTTNSNSGIVTTSFYGRATKIVVEWNSETTNGRKLDIYGKTTKYDAATDLYDSSKQGTKLGTITCGTTTELTIADNVPSDYIGLRSSSGAMYINKIKIYWEQKKNKVIVSQYEWATASFSDRVVVPSDGTVYKVSGATDGTLNLVEVREGKVIGKNVGVLLYKAGGGDLEFVITADDADVLGTDADNKLVATGDISTADYILGTYDGGFGFCHPSTTITCENGKAFLPASVVSGTPAPFLRIGGTTNVANVERIAEDNIYYDLMGRKVEKPERGMYILNGKKVLVK